MILANTQSSILRQAAGACLKAELNPSGKRRRFSEATDPALGGKRRQPGRFAAWFISAPSERL